MSPEDVGPHDPPSDGPGAERSGAIALFDEAAQLAPTEHMIAPANDGNRPLDLLLSSVHCTLLRAGWFVCAPEWGVRGGPISQYILWLGMGGAAEVLMDGVRYRVGPGDVLLMPPGAHRRASHEPANPFRVLAAHFTARVHGVLDLGSLFPPPRAMRPAPARMAALVQTVRRIVRELSADEPGTALAVNGDCARLVALLWREAAARPDLPLPAASDRMAAVPRLAPVLRLIETRYAERLTLAELAAAVHLDPAYFSTVFKGLVGLPPIRYLARYRLDRVRELLLSTDLTIAEIAARTGFRDPFYLSHAFRHAEGMSPSAYRRTQDFAGL